MALESRKKSLNYKALCVKHVLLGSKQLRFMAKYNSATGNFLSHKSPWTFRTMTYTEHTYRTYRYVCVYIYKYISISS